MNTFRIDKKRWLAAVRAVEASRKPLDKSYAEVLAVSKLRLLYSIRAMAHGRVHRRAAELTYSAALELGIVVDRNEFAAAGGTLRFNLGHVHQERAVGDAWVKFVRDPLGDRLESLADVLEAGLADFKVSVSKLFWSKS